MKVQTHLLHLLLIVFYLQFGISHTKAKETRKNRPSNVETVTKVCEKQVNQTKKHQKFLKNTTPFLSNSAIYQGEDYSDQSHTQIRNNLSGFTGSGFVDFGGKGSFIEWDQVNIAENIDTKFLFTYANGSNNNRSCELFINDISYGIIDFEMIASNDWTQWNTIEKSLTLPSGTYNVKLVASSNSGGPNFDMMELVQGTENTDSDTEKPTVPQNLSVHDVTTTSLTLQWDSSLDNITVSGYQLIDINTSVLVSNALISDTNYTLNNLQEGALYTFAVLAIDASGNESSYSNEITVRTNRRPIASIQSSYQTGTVPLTVSFNAAGAYDPDAADVITRYEWDFGDGSPINTQIAPTHTYTEIGDYQITLKVMDNRNGYSDTVSSSIVIDAPASNDTSNSIFTYQGEDRSDQNQTQIRNNLSGFTGSGFVDFGGKGSFIEWDQVNISENIDTKFLFTYANGSSNNRSCELFINDISYGIIDFEMIASNDWTQWNTIEKSIALTSGTYSVKLVASSNSGGPNFDMMEISQQLVNVDTGNGGNGDGENEGTGNGTETGNGGTDNGNTGGDTTSPDQQIVNHKVTLNTEFSICSSPKTINKQISSSIQSNRISNDLEVNKLSIWPNPVENGIIHIQLKETIQDKVLITLYSMLGEIVLTQKLSSNNKQYNINLGQLSKGVYILKVNTSNQTLESKVIIK
ncbi:carbohydrate-binding protein [Olleya sp. HaHaR_3_96]|uniref:carbohydrate-binding protein n=1 Tax=Olleya sp. HaHaR_3_96 TaxID=2745560 RepID=UPI001C4F3F3A|nr:carbohydrate-binding protein [Olleya sp. HaHaR_3_96]QXP59487.1 carbohydrate-binding protein [Olleya sp. HaHaR_3_96]